MSQRLQDLFGNGKPLIAMVHLPPLPGTPLYAAAAGARVDTIADYLRVADGCIVGSDLKVDGYTWNPAPG